MQKRRKCNCGSGSYCRIHRRYALTDNQMETLRRDIVRRRDQSFVVDKHQSCGGGRRVHHMTIGAT